MTSSNPTSIRMPDGLDALVRGLADASKQTDDVPALSQAEVIRLMLRDSGQRMVRGDVDAAAIDRETDHDVDPEQLRTILPDHRIAKFERERVKDEGWLADMKHGFEGRVRDQLAKRFKRGYDPEGIEERAQSWIAEARIYWGVIDDDPEKLAEMISFVEEKVEEYKAKYDSSEYDPDAGWLDGFEGVEEGERKADAEQKRSDMLDTARNKLLQKAQRKGVGQTFRYTSSDDLKRLPAPAVEGVAESVASEHDVDAETADEVVEAAIESFDDDDGGTDDAVAHAAATDGGEQR